MAVVLKITQEDEDQQQEVKIIESLSIGRGVKADLQIKDKALSSVHGVFKLETSGKLFYEDLSSKNGSYLNGLSVYASQMMVEDVLQIGSAEISIDAMSLTTSERYTIGRRVKGNREKDITFFMSKPKKKP